jgi:hypothetical protein
LQRRGNFRHFVYTLGAHTAIVTKP